MLSLLLSACIAADLFDGPLPGESGRGCTLVGCFSSFTLKTSLPVSFEVLRASTVSVCRNGTCYSSSLATLQESHPPDTSGSVRFPDLSRRDTQHTPLIQVQAVRLASGGYQLQFSYEPWFTEGLQNGDVYDVTVTDEQGTRFVDVHETVLYETFQPNGPECGPTCGRATIDRT
jgi:hypothetical protein